MNVAPFEPPIRVVFLGAAELERHFPSRCDWASVRFVVVAPDTAGAAVEATLAFSPDVTVVADPQDLHGARLDLLPGVKVAMITPRSAARGDASALARRLRAWAGARHFDYFTWFEEPPRDAEALPLLQVLPLPVDTERCLSRPQLELRRVLVPTWAGPPPSCLARLRQCAEIVELPPLVAPDSWSEVLGTGGALVYWSRGPLGRLDPLPLSALANGLLVIANTPFPGPWGIEAEDEYLLRPSQDMVVRAVQESVRFPDAMRAVRMRAWQKAREAFSADGAFHRLVHDALLFQKSRSGVGPREPT